MAKPQQNKNWPFRPQLNMYHHHHQHQTYMSFSHSRMCQEACFRPPPSPYHHSHQPGLPYSPSQFPYSSDDGSLIRQGNKPVNSYIPYMLPPQPQLVNNQQLGPLLRRPVPHNRIDYDCYRLNNYNASHQIHPNLKSNSSSNHCGNPPMPLRQYSPCHFTPQQPESNLSNIDVRQFLATWQEKDDDVAEPPSHNVTTSEVVNQQDVFQPLDCSKRPDHLERNYGYHQSNPHTYYSKPIHSPASSTPQVRSQINYQQQGFPLCPIEQTVNPPMLPTHSLNLEPVVNSEVHHVDGNLHYLPCERKIEKIFNPSMNYNRPTFEISGSDKVINPCMDGGPLYRSMSIVKEFKPPNLTQDKAHYLLTASLENDDLFDDINRKKDDNQKQKNVVHPLRYEREVISPHLKKTDLPQVSVRPNVQLDGNMVNMNCTLLTPPPQDDDVKSTSAQDGKKLYPMNGFQYDEGTKEEPTYTDGFTIPEIKPTFMETSTDGEGDSAPKSPFSIIENEEASSVNFSSDIRLESSSFNTEMHTILQPATPVNSASGVYPTRGARQAESEMNSDNINIDVPSEGSPINQIKAAPGLKVDDVSPFVITKETNKEQVVMEPPLDPFRFSNSVEGNCNALQTIAYSYNDNNVSESDSPKQVKLKNKATLRMKSKSAERSNLIFNWKKKNGLPVPTGLGFSAKNKKMLTKRRGGLRGFRMRKKLIGCNGFSNKNLMRKPQRDSSNIYHYSEISFGGENAVDTNQNSLYLKKNYPLMSCENKRSSDTESCLEENSSGKNCIEEVEGEDCLNEFQENPSGIIDWVSANDEGIDSGEKESIKCSLPWVKIFKTHQQDLSGNKDSLELGPAKVELRLASTSVKLKSGNWKIIDGVKDAPSSIVNVKRLILRRRPHEERIPKMVIKKTEGQEYKSFLKEGQLSSDVENYNQRESELRQSEESSVQDTDHDADSSINHVDSTSSSGALKNKQIHHCLLCHESFLSLDEMKAHETTSAHRHLDVVQRNAVHKIHNTLVGFNYPPFEPLTKDEKNFLNWKPNYSGYQHFYHNTPL